MPIVDAGAMQLNYEVLGEGADVVLIHGLGANHAFWYWGAGRMLAQRARVWMYDLRGHGRSTMTAAGYTLSEMAADLLALMDHLGIARSHVVGHSYGARVALCFAGTHPERVISLTVVDTQIRALQAPLRLRDWPHWPKWRQHLVETGHIDLPGEDTVIDFRLLERFSEAAAPREGAGLRPRFRQLSMRNRDMGERGSGRWRRLLETTTAGEELADERPLDAAFVSTIRLPTLLLYGRYSHCLPTSDRLMSLMPDCRRIIIPEAGHFLPAVKPLLFARALNRFVSDPRLSQYAATTPKPISA
jgi:pimeloyl-ACP methyl ester carboxylesterase